MILIRELGNKNIIDLNGLKEFNKDFTVESLNDNDKRQSFYIEYVSSDYIEVTPHGVDKINISIDVENIIENEFILIKNINNEEVKINIIPNEYFANEREYRFKITKSEIKSDGTLRLRILSKVNKDEIGWKCTYNGRPISYIITPMESDKSGNVFIQLNSRMFSVYDSMLKFTQDESGETIKYKIRNTPSGMEIIKQ